jgi:MFS family permease
MSTASTIVPSMMLPFAIFMLVSGAIAATWGRKRILVFGFCGMGVGSLMIILAPTITFVIVGRVFQGLSAAFVLPSMIAFIGDNVEEHTRGKAMGAFMLSITLGTALGPAVGGWLAEWGGIKLVFSVLFLVSIMLAVFYQYFLDRSENGSLDINKILGEILIASSSKKIIGIGIVGGTIFIALIGSMTFSASVLSWAPYNLKAGAVGTILSAGFGGGMLGALIGGVIVDSKGRAVAGYTGLTAMLLGGCVMVCTAKWPESIGLKGFLFSLPLLGFGHAISMTTLETLSVEILPNHKDAATSLFNAIRFSGYAIAPVLGAYFYKYVGQEGTYGLLTSFLLVGFFLFYLLSFESMA